MINPQRIALLWPSFLALGCSSDPQGTSVPPSTVAACHSGDLVLSSEGVGFASPCEATSLTLLPSMKVDGAWRAGGQEGSCAIAGDELQCPAGDLGSVGVSVSGAELVMRVHASRDFALDGLAMQGRARVGDARGWLSNGFQSWSQSGVVALGPPPSDAALADALAARGDSEVDRYGNELSWWYTFAGGGGRHLFAGALSGNRMKPWVQVHQDGNEALVVRLVEGASGERIVLQGNATYEGERWWIEGGTDLPAILERYGDALPSRRREHPVAAEAGWNSWYELWNGVDEQAVRDNAALAKQLLGPKVSGLTPALRIVIDDGWQQKWGEWTTNAKFPSGLDGLAAELRADGLDVGVWFAPLLVEAASDLVAAHPTWFVQGAEYPHAMMGKMRVLDVTEPDAAAHLRGVVQAIRSWGLSFIKIDFLFAGTFEGARYEPVTGMEAYQRALALIREAAGPDMVVLAVGAPPIATFPHVDGWRLGADIALEPMGPSWFFIPNQARSVAARWHLCRATLCDADPPILRDLARDEVETGVWVAALAGGALFLSDDLRVLPQERWSWGLDDARVSAALSGSPAKPDDVFPPDLPATLVSSVTDLVRGKGSHVLPSKWTLPSGQRVVINFTDAPLSAEGATIAPHASRLLPAR